MKEGEQGTTPLAPSRQSARLRIAGVIVLVLGIAGACLVYAMGNTDEEDYSSDPSTAKAYKNELRNTEINFGQSGTVINDLWADLGRPGTQAILIGVGTLIISSGCFYFARLLDHGDDSEPIPK